jgi:hypothetical protein
LVISRLEYFGLVVESLSGIRPLKCSRIEVFSRFSRGISVLLRFFSVLPVLASEHGACLLVMGLNCYLYSLRSMVLSSFGLGVSFLTFAWAWSFC